MYRPLDKFTSGDSSFDFGNNEDNTYKLKTGIDFEINVIKNILETHQIQKAQLLEDLINLYKSNASSKKRFEVNKKIELCDESIESKQDELKKLLLRKKKLTNP